MRELRYIWLFYLAITVICGSGSKLRKLKVVKKVRHGNNTKKVSSSKVPNDGRKGPMSVPFPLPITIPFPIIPAKPTVNKTALKNRQQKKKKNRRKNARNKTVREHQSTKTRNGIINILRDTQGSIPVQVNKHLIQLHKQEDATTDIPVSNITLERLRRGTQGDDLTDAEIFLRYKWLHPEEKDLIPGVESDFYIPEDLKFIDESQRDLERHIREIIPFIENYKRDIKGEKDNEQFGKIQYRETRGVDGDADVEAAKKRLLDAEKAAEALTNIEIEAGVDPNNLVENTHKYVVSLNVEKGKYDALIRRHIVEIGDAIKRSLTNKSSSGVNNSTAVLNGIQASKRQLEGDRGKLEEINTELRELKDIEIMATGLEVAKYIARERALENLATVRSNIGNMGQSKTKPVSPVPPATPFNVAPPVAQVAQMAPVAQVAQMAPVAPAQVQQLVSAAAPTSSIAQYPAMQPPVVASFAKPAGYAYPPPYSYYPNMAFKPSEAGDQRHALPQQTILPGQPAVPAINNQMANYYHQMANYYHPQYAAPNNAMYSPNYAQYQATAVGKPNIHVEGDQRHVLSNAGQAVTRPTNYIQSYAQASKLKVGTPDHEITKIEHAHKVDDSDKENSDNNEGNHDWGGMLSFPGTTYSPPPSWLSKYNEPDVRHQQSPPNQQVHPVNPAAPAPVPYGAQSIYQPRVLETGGASYAAAPIVPAVTAFAQHPYSQQTVSLSDAIASTLRRPNAQSLTLMPSLAAYARPSYTANTKAAALMQTPTTGKGLHADAGKRVDLQANTAYPMTQGTGGPHEVIKVAPQDETITIHNPAALAPPENRKNDTGTLPYWMGAVDGAKFGEDVSDRLRAGTNFTESTGTPNHAIPNTVDTARAVQENYQNLNAAEGTLKDVKVAAHAVSGIEKAVGLDSESIVKLIDFVKRSALADVETSTDTVNKDKAVLRDVQGGMNAKKTDTTADLSSNNVALSQAELKVRSGEGVLNEAKQRLEKIKRMEMMVTGIEVAKYYAQTAAAKKVQGYKRTLKAAIKRNEIAQKKG